MEDKVTFKLPTIPRAVKVGVALGTILALGIALADGGFTFSQGVGIVLIIDAIAAAIGYIVHAEA